MDAAVVLVVQQARRLKLPADGLNSLGMQVSRVKDVTALEVELVVSFVARSPYLDVGLLRSQRRCLSQQHSRDCNPAWSYSDVPMVASVEGESLAFGDPEAADSRKGYLQHI